jgi:hypothetical protein
LVMVMVKMNIFNIFSYTRTVQLYLINVVEKLFV